MAMVAKLKAIYESNSQYTRIAVTDSRGTTERLTKTRFRKIIGDAIWQAIYRGSKGNTCEVTITVKEIKEDTK